MNLVFTSLMMFLFTLLSRYDSVSGECDYDPSTGKLCSNQVYDPEDLRHPRTYNPTGIMLINMEGQINLIVSKKFREKGVDNAIYKTFYIGNSCVKDIEDDFFRYLDKDTKSLEEITFRNVTCLKKLSTAKFRGIGAFVKVLTFESMKDLSEIDNDFFDSFTGLVKLMIVNTSISLLPNEMLTKMRNLTVLKVTNNRLTVFPLIPGGREKLVANIEAQENPFDCQCSLQFFVMAMRKVLSVKSYKCATPSHLKDQSLAVVDLCEKPLPKVKEMKNQQTSPVVATSNIRMEIIIAVSLITLLVVIIVIVVVLYKRHGHSKPQKPEHELRSPSKIVFQNDGDSKPFLHNARS